jgi:hypothetical protein
MLTECGWARSGPPRYARWHMSKIEANAVLVLARAQGHAWVDEAAAHRIAAGATAAVAAVEASLRQGEAGLLIEDPAGFLMTLEQLAELPP